MSIRPMPLIAPLVLLWPACAGAQEADSGRRAPTAAIGQPDRIPMPRRGDKAEREGTASNASTGWWFGTGGIVVALAVFGAISIASRKYLPGQGGDLMQVIGRTSLTARHSAILLKVGEQVFVVGVGPQGAPTLLGEVADPEELRGTSPPRRAPASLVSVVPKRPEPAPTARPGGLDLRIGDD